MSALDLPLIFTGLMGFAILAYVVLDGYDLGVGILLPAATPCEQNIMVSSIGPFWDANETWLVLGIGLLLVAFPVAHGMVLTALYLPVLVMLIGLILRGVAFEFRVKAQGWHRELWNWLFGCGSIIAALAQGLMLGLYVVGFAHGVGDYLFAAVVALGVAGGYVMLGGAWLIARTEGTLQHSATRWTRWGQIGVALGLLLVIVGTALENSTIREKWLQLPMLLLLLPLALIAVWSWVWHATRRLEHRLAGSSCANLSKHEWMPFFGAVSIYVIAFLGLGYSLFPYIVVARLTIWQAAAHPSSLRFVLIGALIVLPMILAYSVFSYYVFRGKVRE
ncbi:MAG: cytochrome d ubiquinol oxidase subunit II [Chromatiales bacterium]|jgi:cytochrome d ubiquinol oxidase subunit II|nr:cytochrome d ubiquinol oxidase subunit II [Chromatiales bacterium]